MEQLPEEVYAYLEQRIDDLKTDRTGDEKQTEGEVFDRKTLMVIYDFMKAGMVDTVHYSVSTGKEGNVFYATDEDGDPLAIKIYRTSNAGFKRISKYIEGDPRFRGLSGNHWKIIYAWATKEFRNLQRYREADIRVPEPIDFEKNCLLMEFIGDETGPAPLLKDSELKRPNMTYREVVSFIVDGYRKAHLVHGDLSEYNILMWNDKPVLIDCGQALTADHFNAKEYLARDIANVNRFFRSRDVDVISDAELMEKATKGVILKGMKE
jgi:RIO kinase 1